MATMATSQRLIAAVVAVSALHSTSGANDQARADDHLRDNLLRDLLTGNSKLLSASPELHSYSGDVRSAISALDSAVITELSPATVANSSSKCNPAGSASCNESSLPKCSTVATTTSLQTRGEAAWHMLGRLASSDMFVNKYWHKRPVVLRSHELVAMAAQAEAVGKGNKANKGDEEEGQSMSSSSSWVDGLFTVERDLRLVEGTHIAGYRTTDTLRNMTQPTDEVQWSYQLMRSDPSKPMTWEDVEDGLKGGTISFRKAGNLWPSIGALSRLMSAAFGLPINANVYITPPGVSISVPFHTDRMDVFVFQTAGAKHWRVHAPPAPRKRGVDPLNRGRLGDVMKHTELAGTPLIDTVLQTGDLLYLPAGFPHATDTFTNDCTVMNVDKEKEDAGADKCDLTTLPSAEHPFNETSVSLTMGLESRVWGLTYSHLRWSALQRCGKEFALNMENLEDDVYWKTLDTIPVGFLGGQSGCRQMCLEGLREGNGMDRPFRDTVVAELKKVMVLLEPDRWATENHKGENGVEKDEARESLPNNEELGEVVEYMFHNNLLSLLDLQEDMFRNVDLENEDAVEKAYQSSQKQSKVMEQFSAFSKSTAAV